MEIITSVSNQAVKAACNLKQKKYRLEEGCFLAEGLRTAEEAVAYGRVTRLFMAATEDKRTQELRATAEAKGIAVYQVEAKVMEKLSDTKSPQGVVAVVQLPQLELEDLEGAIAKAAAKERRSLEKEAQRAAREGTKVKVAATAGLTLANNPVVVLDRVQDPGNMGTIIRTADAVGAAAVVLLAGCVDAYGPKVVRASMGSLFHVPVVENVSEEEIMTWCYREGYQPLVTCLEGAKSLYKTDLTKKLAVFMGNEANGVSAGLLQAAELKVYIPMPGKAESMNVAMAAGLVLYEGLRQRS